MNQAPDPIQREQAIEQLLAELGTGDELARRRAIFQLSSLGRGSQQVIDALRERAFDDPSVAVREAAHVALTELEGRPTIPLPTPQPAWLEYSYGFFGWFAINGLFYVIVPLLAPKPVLGLVYVGILMLNVGLLAWLAFERPRIAMGMGVAFAIALVIGVIFLGMLFLQFCFQTVGA